LQIFQFFPLGALDAPLDLNQKALGRFTYRFTEMMQDARRGKRPDSGEVAVVQIRGGVEAAAGQNGKLDARGQEGAETRLQLRIVQPLQQAAFGVVAKIGQTVLIDLIRRAAGLLHEQLAHVRFFRRAVAARKRLRHSGAVLLSERPEEGPLPAGERPGIGYVKDMFEIGFAGVVLVDQGDPLGAAAHIAAHGLVPQVVSGAGRRVRALGVN